MRPPAVPLRYLATAVLVRGADGGAAVGLVLLALEHGGALSGGLLAAALSAPHLAGPWLAARLDRARDGRRLLAASYLLYGTALAAGALTVGRLPVALAAVAVAGACGPLLTGGLSSRLAGVSSARAQGWDALTYGIGGTAGPALVAGLAALAGPLAAVLALSAAAVVASVLALSLPPVPAPVPARDGTGGTWSGVRVLAAPGPLRRVTVLTLLTAVQLGAMPVIAGLLGPHLAGRPGAAGALTVAYGAGNLAGGLLVTAVPLRGDPERAALRLFTVLGAVTAACALAPSLGWALAGFALVGAGNAASFTATLAARAAYAPPAARAQVFVTSAGLKVAVSAAGAALAGTAAGLGGAALLLAAAALAGAAVLLALADRALTSEPAISRDLDPGRRGRRAAAGRSGT
ncbi:MFS transporter [Actinomadura parmotrematis]|uniref:MFS transporter n=1 Tax=Actinomadura parmotrematis TaxID=2864039 RepID=A0ABS7FY63_9ACTN|nr:MFS transporter [Actinomadura parmotrematis]MBW8485373.1 MFS transporter [Actinomadura parmotrematis]